MSFWIDLMRMELHATDRRVCAFHSKFQTEQFLIENEPWYGYLPPSIIILVWSFLAMTQCLIPIPLRQYGMVGLSIFLRYDIRTLIPYKLIRIRWTGEREGL